MGIVVNIACTVAKLLFNIWTAALIIPLMALKYWIENRRKHLKTSGRLDGKTYMVTGCNKGLGFLTALELSKRGARVLMACRNLGSAHLAKNTIIHMSGNDDIDVYRLDMSSFWSVRQCCKDINENEGRLDGIIFNASVGVIKNKMTKDELPLAWQINHYSTVLVTQLLLGLMKKSELGQIIFVSSVFHHFHNFDLEDLLCKKQPYPWTTYCNTKLANIMTSKVLAEKLKGTNITVNCVNPGLVYTDILRRFDNKYFQGALNVLLEMFGKAEVLGAATTLTVALEPALKSVSGKYFSNCTESHCVASKAKDMDLARKLWDKSIQMIGLQPDELTIQ